MNIKGLDELFGEAEEHESFGQIKLSKVQVGRDGANLFGSSIRHETVFSISIFEASKRIKHGKQKAFPEKELIAIDLSPAQFTEFITNPNVGFGVPCTIRRFNGAGKALCPEFTQRQVIDDEFKKELSGISKKSIELIDEAENLLAQKTLKKSEQNLLLEKLQQIRTELECNIPHIQSLYSEAMDETVKEAKSEVEAFLTSKLEQIGVEAIQENVKKVGFIP